MAAVAKSGTPSVATPTPARENTITGLLATEAIAAGDACRVTATGVTRSIGTAADAAAVVDGFAAAAAQAGEAVTLYANVHFHYGAGMAPGTFLYLSGTVAGGLDTVIYVNGTVTGSTAIVARVLKPTLLHVQRSY